MERVTWEKEEPRKYFVDGKRVVPTVVYGPILCYFVSMDEGKARLDIDGTIRGVKQKTGVDLEKVADGFLSGGMSMTQPAERVADGNVPERNIRSEFVVFVKLEDW